MYAIIDVETTGLNARSDRITEIAIVLHDGERITGSFESLINPECRIPYGITALTGISNKKVAEAPKFQDVARQIVELTEGRAIVAHNAAFDYQFLRSEFRRLFYDFRRKTLCTKKLSRKLIPGAGSYGLGSLCRQLGIENQARHRAGGDARATALLLNHLLSIERNLEHLPLRDCRSNLSREDVMNLPDEPGVYYFHDQDGTIIYIGKSVGIRSRVLSHLSNNANKRAIEMRDRVASVTCERTGSELIACLLESHEIKAHKPVFNRSLRRSTFNYGLFSHTGKDGYIHLKIEPLKGDRLPLTSYASREEGRNHLVMLQKEYGLCQKICHLYDASGPCFEYQLGECLGACKGEESRENYNDRVIDAIGRYSYHNKNFFIIDDGREPEEVSVVKVENGRYMGFGYLGIELIGADPAVLHEVIKPFEDNRDIHVILRGYLRKNKFEKLLVY
jgi:DNA polymerase-3 subunit epsilon